MEDEISFVKRDSEKVALRKFPLAKYLRIVHEKTNKTYGQQFREFFRLRKSMGKIDVNDYFYYRLYDDSLYDWEEKQRFVSTKLFWKYTPICCPTNWWAVSEDKWVAECILKRNGVPCAESLAAVAAEARTFGDVETIGDAGRLDSFLRAAELPIFAKPLGSLGSIGAAIIEAYDDKSVHLSPADDVALGAFFEMVKGGGYVFQKLVRPHQELRKFGSHLGTVRLINFVHRDRISTPHTIWKITAHDNIADNYWRVGNMLADLDAETGEVRRVVSGSGPELEEHTRHPDTGAQLIGFRLPYWRETRDLNRFCAGLFAPLRYNSLDVAITDDGPVVIEVNVGSAFNLSQLATGRGFLTEEACDFLESCGVKLDRRR